MINLPLNVYIILKLYDFGQLNQAQAKKNLSSLLNSFSWQIAKY